MSELTPLRSADLPDRLSLLGFRSDDAQDVMRHAEEVLRQPRSAELVDGAARALRERLGQFLEHTGPWPDPFAGLDGVLGTLALITASAAVQRWHADRGVNEEVSAATLSDLGRQLALHRRVRGHFGLDSPHRLLPTWQGSMYHLGRLQLGLVRMRAGGRRAAALPPELRDQQWLLVVQIPQTGPLRDRTVEESLLAARPFFDKHFPGAEPRYATCTSWLLDPYLVRIVPPESHVARFQRRFTQFGPVSDADADAVYFTFGRYGLDDLDSLPRDTPFRRAVLDRIAAGEHWHLVQGFVELP